MICKSIFKTASVSLLVMLLPFFSTSGVAPPPARSSPLAVFPGAQGFGTYTPAGRGGRIIKVTNLNNAGNGSLRAAIETREPRIIVFEVGGTIELKKDLKIKDPYVTIAGQTAPSPGITLKGAGLVISSHDVLVQHLRIRVGDARKGPDPENREGLKVVGKGTKVHNVVCDHLSISWGVDEVVSIVYGPREVTISNSIISEGLQDSVHPEGTHSKALLVREGTQHLALIGNLFAHNHDRNPRIVGDSSVVAVNNLFYNAGRKLWFDIALGTHGVRGPHLLSAVGNVFIEGPNTPHYALPIRVKEDCLPGTKIYHSDNLASGSILKFSTPFDPQVSSPPVWDSSIMPRPGTEVEVRIFSHAGARPADRDAVDQRIIREVKTRSGSIINSVRDAGGWPALAKALRPFRIPEDPHGDRNGDGYSNIEEELHRMARKLETEASLEDVQWAL